MAQTEVKPITEQELSSILSGNVESILTPEEPNLDDKKEPEEVKEDNHFKQPINTSFDWKELKEIVDENNKDGQDDDPQEVKIVSTESPIAEEDKEKKAAGRKPSDIVSITNDLIKEGVLFGFADPEDESKTAEIKTIEDVKDLIKANIEEVKNSNFEDLWKNKIQSFSPQIQFILQYAENGGTDVSSLMGAITEVEKTNTFTLDDEEGQESIVREYLKVQGWEEDLIKEEIETAKDLGKLKNKAEKFLPKINQMNEQRLQTIMAEQEERRAQAEEARRSYLGKLKSTLDKEKVGEVKLARQDKSLIWSSLTDVSYTSFSGQPTNGFFKRLEDLQIGKDQDYDHFMEIVHLAMDREGFKRKYKEQAANSTAAETARKLKVQEKKIANSSETFTDDDRTPKIKRQPFKNPWG